MKTRIIIRFSCRITYTRRTRHENLDPESETATRSAPSRKWNLWSEHARNLFWYFIILVLGHLGQIHVYALNHRNPRRKADTQKLKISAAVRIVIYIPVPSDIL